MEIRFPAYYEQFRCIAGACPDSCCKEWTVDVDEDAAKYYRSLPGALGDRLRQVLTDEESGIVMEIENGRCPMWREDGLCRIQAELGHDALCQTCRNFPRLTHDYGTFLEKDLELSCPEAARLILTGDDAPVCQDREGEEAADYDQKLMSALLSGREQVLRFLRSGTYSPPQTIAVVLCHAHSVQAWIDGGEPVLLQPQECLLDANIFAGTPDWDSFFSLFKKLEILTPQWKQRLEEGFKGSPWSDTHLRLFAYFLRRYWLQAVSDGDLVCRVSLAVAGCLMVYAMGGDPTETAQLFSKEIENDPDNVEAILDACYTHKGMTDANLLGLLLNS